VDHGEVWRGRDVWQDAEVAIKLVGPHVTLDEVLLETQLLTRLREHDRVVTIGNVAIAPPLPYIVMDYAAQTALNDGEVGPSFGRR
jgi:serine/threonine protein kinase